MEKALDLIVVVIVGIVVGILVSLFLAWLTEIAWEYSVAQIFHLPNITYWQAFWLNIFGSTVVKSVTPSSSSK